MIYSRTRGRAMTTGFRIIAVPGVGLCTLVLVGEADLAVAADIVELGTASLSEAATQTLVIDMGELTFIDSTVMGSLINLQGLATNSGKSLALARIPARIQRAMSVAGLEQVFTLVE
jgi:anti-sigma B factor antagonist